MDQFSSALYQIFLRQDQSKHCALPQHYVHEPLVDARSRLRLIVLFPGRTGPLRCSIFEVPFDAAPEYEAISYCWGDPTPTRTLWIGNKRLRTATSVVEVLGRVRRWNQFRILWIDAASISQEDLDEKSSQILLMKQIFQEARRVLVYLGSASDESKALPDLLLRIRATKIKHLPRLLYRSRFSKRSLLPANEYERAGLPALDSGEWTKFILFFLRPWFRRIWVIQEIVLSQQAIAICGEWQLPWGELEDVIKLIILLRLPHAIETKGKPRLWNDLQLLNGGIMLKDSLTKNKKWKFIDILEQFRSAESRDDRDKIYGLLGLAEAFGERFSLPDYRKDKITIYAEFAKYFVEHGDGLAMLYNCFADKHWNGPSWVPNWGAEPPQIPPLHPFSGTSLDSVTMSHRASASSTTKIHLDYRDHMVLCVEGLCVDTVQSVSVGHVLELDSKVGKMQAFATIVIEMEDLLEYMGSERYPTGETQDEAIWKTLVCEIQPEFEEEYMSSFGELFTTGKRACSQIFVKLSSRWKDSSETPSNMNFSSLLEWNYIIEHFHPLMKAARENLLYRRRCLTRTGLIGQVPQSTEFGDVIFIPCGSAVPFVLRPEGSNFKIIGDCYIHGLMKGEAFSDPECTTEIIKLV